MPNDVGGNFIFNKNDCPKIFVYPFLVKTTTRDLILYSKHNLERSVWFMAFKQAIFSTKII